MITRDINSLGNLTDTGTFTVTHIGQTYYKSRSTPNDRKVVRVYFSNGLVVRLILPTHYSNYSFCYTALAYLKKLKMQKKIAFNFKGAKDVNLNGPAEGNSSLSLKMGFSYSDIRVRRVNEL